MKMPKSLQLKPLAIAILIGCCPLTGNVLAAPGGVPGPGGGGGGGGGGAVVTPDLGDLIVLKRDTNGVPELTPELCQQPLAAPDVPLPAIGDQPECTPASGESCVIPVDPATCAIVPGYDSYTQEVDFGRSSVVRSPDSVLANQLDDAIVNLATADCITLDPSGRLVTSTVDANTEAVTSAAIDSPLQNLAIYKQLLLTGQLGADNELPLPTAAAAGIQAARALGAAVDKSGKVTVDMVVYTNEILGLNSQNTIFGEPNCENIKEEVQGKVEVVNRCFANFGSFSYDRKANFGALPSPAYIPKDAPEAGTFEYLSLLDSTIPSFGISRGPITAAVPELMGNPELTGDNIGGFTQAADDARATINFMHSWPLPTTYTTALQCAASGNIRYDVSISSKSGLQVPVRMVAGTEGREFTLTIANAGPDAASGTVTVTTKDAEGNDIPGLNWEFPFENLAAGASKSWTQAFSYGFVTTINWTATISSEYDVNSNNNSVTATTQVIGSGSGGGGGGPGGNI